MNKEDFYVANYFMLVIAKAEEVWHERKGLNYVTRPGERKRQLNRVKKHFEELKELIPKLEFEIKVIEEMESKT